MPNNYKKLKENGKYQNWLNYSNKYQKENYLSVNLKFNKKEDYDICEFLRPYIENKKASTLIRRIIRAYIARRNK